MTNIPGSSRACAQCRARRVKCGLEQPSCARCLRRGAQCSGPTVGSIFVQRDIHNIHASSDRQLLNSAVRQHSGYAPGRPKKSVGISTSNADPGPGKESVPPCELAPRSAVNDFYRSVVVEFWTLTCGSAAISPEQDVQAPMTMSAQAVLPLATLNKTLDSGIFVVSALYLARARENHELQNLAMAAYPGALQQFRSEISSFMNRREASQGMRHIHIVATALCLLFYEWLLNGPTGTGADFHLQGALNIILSAEDECLTSPHIKAYYADIRNIAVMDALRKRRTTVLTQSPWPSITDQLSSGTLRDSLLDIVTDIPCLLERGDKLKLIQGSQLQAMRLERSRGDDSSEGGNCELTRKAMQFLQECDLMTTRMYKWLEYLKESESGTLWWHTEIPSSALSPQSNVQENGPCVSHYFEKPIEFSSSRVPGLLVQYWAAMLELSLMVSEIHTVFNIGELYTDRQQNLFEESMLVPVDEDICQLAVCILATARYLRSSMQGSTLASIPALIAERYLNSQVETDYSSIYNTH